MTGSNAARHRVTNWTLQKNVKTDMKSDVIAIPEWNFNGIAQVPGTDNTYLCESFVQLLKDSGYHTVHCGKAHWGAIDTPGENPCHFGFEENITGSAAGGVATYLSERNYGHDDSGEPVSLFAVEGMEKYWKTGTFLTEALTQEALCALDKAKAYLQGAIEDDIKMPDIADRMNMSYTKFRRLFKQYTGQAPAQYFLNLKIHRAKEMLRGTNASVKEISYILHFENPEYFATLFKRRTGVSPSDFRKQ